MPEPMSLLQQANTFKKTNRQRLLVDQTVRCPPVHSTTDHLNGNEKELKTLSFHVYTNKHLPSSGKLILPLARRKRFDELILPSVEKDNKRHGNVLHQSRGQFFAHKAFSHSETTTHLSPTQSSLTTRATRTELQITIPTLRDNETVFSYRRHHAPPPSPSDDEIERLLFELQEGNPSCSSSEQSTSDTDEYVPFRLPALQRSAQIPCPLDKSPCKNIRSTLSNYLQKYY